MRIWVFWDVMLYLWIRSSRRSEGTCCHHSQPSSKSRRTQHLVWEDRSRYSNLLRYLTDRTTSNFTFLNHALWYNTCSKNQHNAHFFINDLIQLYCLRYDSNNQVFILRKNCTCRFMVIFMSTPTRLLILMHKTYNETACTTDVWLTVHRNSVWVRKTN